MSCTNPLIGVPKKDEVGMFIMHPLAFIQKYCSKTYTYKFEDAKTGEEQFEFYHSILQPKLYEFEFSTQDKLSGKIIKMHPMYIPCGKCLGCRLDSSREMANRNVMESMVSEKGSSYFITLTYDDDHLPLAKKLIYDCENYGLAPDEEIQNYGTLQPKHCQLFMKSLREKADRLKGWKNIRCFYCGEYGGTTARPHYHFLVYNLPLDDLEIYKTTLKGDCLYNSPFVSDCWEHGYSVIAEFNWQTCAYVSRYIMKKQSKGKFQKGYYNDQGLHQEFVRCSNKPGIAFDFYMKHMEQILEEDKIVLPSVNGVAHVVTPGRYFTKCIENSGRYDWMEKLSYNKQKRRERAADMLKERHFMLTDDDAQYFADLEVLATKTYKTLNKFRDKC